VATAHHTHALFARLVAAPKNPQQIARGFDAYSVTFDGHVAVGQALPVAQGVMLRRLW